MPRFVLLRHECPPESEKPSHWDFMLEQADALWTWELRELPASWQKMLGQVTEGSEGGNPCEISARRLPNHRLAYLEVEGPISNNRGTVARIDSGEFELLEQRPGQLKVRLIGEQVRDRIQLISTDDRDNWVLQAGRA